MQESQDQTKELAQVLKAMMTGPVEKRESHDGKDFGCTMKTAMKKAFSEEKYAKFLWRVRYRGGR